MVPSTISPPIVTTGDIISKVDITYVNHIIRVTHARPFGLHVPEAMSAHARLAKIVLVYCTAHTWLVPTSYVNLDMLADTSPTYP
jgi:hypothetical protein